MRLPDTLIEGHFLERPNRFAAVVRLASDGEEVLVHVANSGRMKELLHKGNRVLLTPVQRSGRKTSFDLALVEVDGVLVSADARMPSGLVVEAVDKGLLVPLQDYRVARREVVFGESRLDLLLEGPRDFCFVEVKSVTLVEGGKGLFPDAPTTRGRKHVGSLVQAVREGHRAAVVFVVQREDVIGFRPNDNADPEFGQALREAVRQGVGVHAFRCHVTPRTVEIDLPVPVSL